MTSPYDDGWLLDNLAAELSPGPFSVLDVERAAKAETCGGCDAALVTERHDDRGRSVRDFACGHRYVVGKQTVSIERV